MNKLFKTIISIVGISMAFAGCTGDFDNMNTDPNNPTPGSVDPKFQLIFIQGRGIPYANQWQQIDQLMISTLCEYSANDGLSASDYNIDSRYIDDLWNLSYTVLTNANSLISANEDKPIYNNVVQMARIWKAYVMLRLTNCIGDVPYSEAAITAGVFAGEDDAAYMKQGEDKFSQNPIYYHKGSAVMHMSTAYKRLVTGIGGQAWPTAADRVSNANITEAIIAAKNAPATVDPRAPIQFEPAGMIDDPQDPAMKGNWDGTDPGHVTSAVGAAMDNGQFVSNFAKIGPWYYGTIDRKYQLFKYSELCFLKAIAIERGLIAGNAKDAYEAGVRSNMAEFDIPEAVITDYLASTAPNYYGTTAKYDDTTGDCNTHMDKILTQKYIAQFQECSFETWADHRQFHKPTLMPFASVSSSVFTMNPADQANNTPNAYVKRIYYPSSEYTVNAANVKEAESRMGGTNSIQNNVWWDVD